MNRKQMITMVFLVLILVLSLGGQCFAAGNPFTDLNDVPEKNQILDLQAKGYIKGVANGLFSPDATITAAQSIQLFVNTFGLNIDDIKFIKKPEATDYFKKANDNAWYANALIIASFHVPDLPADLNPNQKWTREEFTYYLVKTIEKKYNLPMINLVPAKITDENQMTIEYNGAIQRALTYGIIKLDKDGALNPKAKITRAEAAAQVYQALEYVNVK